MSFSAFIGFQGWNSWTPDVSGLSLVSVMPRPAMASLLPGWLLSSSLGGLMSILVSWLELSSASRLRAAALSEAALSEESCANDTAASSTRKIRNRIRTPPLYRFRVTSKQAAAATRGGSVSQYNGEKNEPPRTRSITKAFRLKGFLRVPSCPLWLRVLQLDPLPGYATGDERQQKNQAAHRWDGLVWQSPPGRRVNLYLQRRRIRTRRRSLVAGRLRWGRSRPGVGHQADIHAAVLGAAAGSFIRLDRLILAQPDQINLVARNVLLRSQVLNHRIGAALAQIVVVLCAAHRVGRALYRDDVSLDSGNAGGKLVDGFPGFLRQIVLVESEMQIGRASCR